MADDMSEAVRLHMRSKGIAYLRGQYPELDDESAGYLVDLYHPNSELKLGREASAQAANRLLIDRMRIGSPQALRAVFCMMSRFRDLYEEARLEHCDPVPLLMAAGPMGEAVAKQHVEMFEILDGDCK